jgi:hypothetical protein
VSSMIRVGIKKSSTSTSLRMMQLKTHFEMRNRSNDQIGTLQLSIIPI